MKKLYALCAAFITAFSLSAQVNPERMVIKTNLGNSKGYLVERISEVTFPKVEGAVKADIQLVDVTLEEVAFAVKRSEACEMFKLTIIPKVFANRLTSEEMAADFIDNDTQQLYAQDFTNGVIDVADAGLTPDAEYSAYTLGFDKYGCACGVSRVDFKTLKPEIIGNPQVEYVIEDVNRQDFTLTFTPNEDVKGFSVTAGEKGALQQQFEDWGAMFGFSNFSEMLKGFGVPNEEGQPLTWTWSDMAPGTDYEVFIQAWDQAGTFCDPVIVNVTTDAIGGTGAAVVDITIGEYKQLQLQDKTSYLQNITFTPNDQTASYRYLVELKSIYDEDEDGCKEWVMSEPPMPNIAYWWQYDELSENFAIEPETEYVVLTAGKNANGEWGELKFENHTTPAADGTEVAQVPLRKTNIGRKNVKQSNAFGSQFKTGKVPAFNLTKKAGIVIKQK